VTTVAVEPRARLRALVGIGRMSAQSMITYRFNLLFGIAGALVQIYLLRVVWHSVYHGRGAVNGVTLDVQVAYSSLAALQSWLLNPWLLSDIPQRVRDGSIAMDLLRPVRFLPQAFASQVGSMLAMLPFAIVALPFAILVGGAVGPVSTTAFLGYLAGLITGFLVSALANLAMSMVTFWTLEVGGILMTYRMIQQFFSGALVPLWFMPGWLHGIASALPFQSAGYTPLAIYLGRESGGKTLELLAEQVGWIIVLWLLLRLIWSRALLRVVVQGG
jgi:viologen exporter family transport system permease protein